MATGRKAIHLEMRGGKNNRQRVWEAIRSAAESFTSAQVARKARVDHATVRTYLQGLMKGGYVTVIGGGRTDGRFEEQTLTLTNDVGAEAPAVTRDGKASTAGTGTEAMWRTLRILGELDAQELANQASIATPTTRSTAMRYLQWLVHAGYVQIVSKGAPGKPARYRLIPQRYSGPRPPMIQRIGQVFDPNLGKVVYRQPEPEGDE
ncbi:hypothetical protein VUJ49_22880 [Pseudomonas berkeleyensis]|uniref:Helix-turn-helix domain-containing protein n=1 Tax=Pseudomonas berkeleyensis TaxID=2726956 RepID=A0A7G5DM37_9PSED|nr:hypothetical protein [Pseudomonas berkeleyensis]QMV62812.1 hypothetical protein HS968_22785 [Pseudomonas berkeleyensis]WSO38266.1 hypothetical protein VUJ49_22880 [Pseudomonas berkeleyensis]